MTAEVSDSTTSEPQSARGTPPDSTPGPVTARFLEEFYAQISAKELLHYKGHQDEIRREFERTHLPRLVASTNKQRTELAAADTARAVARRAWTKLRLLIVI